MLGKEKEIRRLTAIIEKEKEKVEQMKAHVIELQAPKQKHHRNECNDNKSKSLSRVNKNNGKRKKHETNISNR